MSSDTPLIHIRTLPPRVEVRRGEAVPDIFWLLVRAEWGSEGGESGRLLTVPIERFLAQLAWLAPACRRHKVGIAWDSQTKKLIQSLNMERAALQRALTQPSSLDIKAVEALLQGSGSRFLRALRQFQKRDLVHLLSLPHGANFSVPGAGKTAVAYSVFEAERLNGRIERMLVVSPISAFTSWMEEAHKCFHPIPAISRYNGDAIPPESEILLVNYQRLASDYDKITQWVLQRPTLAVLDEAHRMKRGWSGLWGSSCLNLAFLAERRDILTGTPAPQSPADLVALIDYLWPNQARSVLPAAALLPDPAPNTIGAVANAIRPLFVRTTKRELALRAPDYSAIMIPLQGIHAEIYAALLNQYRGSFVLDRTEMISFAQMGEVVMYMLEAATNPALLAAGSSRHDPLIFRHPPLAVPAGSRLSELLAQYGQYETPSKFIHLAQILKANAELGRRTLVWSNFVRNLEILNGMLARYRPAMIHGGIPSEITEPNALRTREQELARFKGEDSECMVLLANPAATGEGISLHEVCHDAIYLERTFNAGLYLQSVDRIHRLGLLPDEMTRITFLITEGTIDEHVDRRVRVKADALGLMLEDPDIVTMALPDEEDYGKVLDSAEDLAALFAHLRGA